MKRISHYTIVDRIGSGGMGDVYLAEDVNLGRKVALKLLPEQFTRDSARLARFQNEARAVSALNHPNILTIFEIGESAGEHFIVTEFIDGETLRDRLSRGPLAVPDVVAIAEGVLAALSEAHGAGVVHRDIKPENIMIRRDGLVKVLDFGLAKLGTAASPADSATAIRATAPGTVLGTVTYMSPEQARGLDVDGRTDLFSVGAILYEMLTGHVPFEGQTSTDILAAILHREPAPIARYGADVSHEMQWLVEKALNKERDERYQTAKEMLGDLRRVRRDLGMTSDAPLAALPQSTPARQSDPSAPVTESSPPRKTVSSAEYIVSGISSHRRAFGGLAAVVIAVIAATFYFTSRASAAIDSVAVLPFANSGDRDAEYMADGLTENLINSLSEIRELRVVPRSSVFRYKGSKLPLEQIAKELGARAILTGRLQKQGDSFTLQADLVDAEKNSQLWGQRFEVRPGELMGIERRLAQSAAAQLRPRLTDSEQQRVEKARTMDPEAYDLYMKGRFHWNKRNPQDIRKSIDFFKRALDRDPSFALAWAGLAEAYVVLPNYDESVTAGDAYPKVREAAQRALAIDPDLAEAHATLSGVLLEYDWKFAEAEKEMRRAIELKPSYAAARYWYADYLSAVGRHQEAVAQATAARAADPLSIIAAQMVAVVYIQSGRPDEALQALHNVDELDPDRPQTHNIRARALLQKNRVEEAAAEYEKFSALIDDEGPLVIALVLRGRRAEAEAIAAKLAALAEQGKYTPYHLAGIYAALGNSDQAFRWLDQAYASRFHRVVYMAADPQFDPIRNDPRFEALLRRIGLPTNLGYQSEWGRKMAERARRGKGTAGQ